MSALVWQCVCDARIEGDAEEVNAAKLIVQFIDMHLDCAPVWRARWYPERDPAHMTTQAERATGFEIPDPGDREP